MKDLLDQLGNSCDYIICDTHPCQHRDRCCGTEPVLRWRYPGGCQKVSARDQVWAAKCNLNAVQANVICTTPSCYDISDDTTGRKLCMGEIRKLPGDLQQLHDSVTIAVWGNELPLYLRTTAVKKTLLGNR